MTNPNNAIGTNGAYSGRTSPEALNDVACAFSRGILSGWQCSPASGMTVELGGVAGVRDVAIAIDNAGNRATINNRSGAPVDVTLGAAHTNYNRIDCIVAYVAADPTGDGKTTDNPSACGIIAVAGTPAANPTAPSESTIRSAITTDGAAGARAAYVILATITVGANVASIGSGAIQQGILAAGRTPVNGVTASSNAQASNLSTSWSNLYTIDVSKFPTGATFQVIANVALSTSASAEQAARLVHGSQAGKASQFLDVTWGQTHTVISGFVKEAGVNTVAIQGQVSNNPNSAWGFTAAAFLIG